MKKEDKRLSNAERIERATVEAIRLTFGHVEAREVLWNILTFCEVYRANEGDSEFRRGISEGKRRVGLYIEDLLSVIEEGNIIKWKKEMAIKEKQDENRIKEDVFKQRRYAEQED